MADLPSLAEEGAVEESIGQAGTSAPCKKLSTSELNSGLLEICSALKVLLKQVSGAVRACREHLQSEGDSAAETPSRNLRNEAVPSQPEISDEGAAETAQAVCQPCNVEPHALSFGVRGPCAETVQGSRGT